MPPQSLSAENGVCQRMRSGRSCAILTIVPGHGRPSMESMVTRSSQRSPVIRTIGYSFLLPVAGAVPISALSVPAATTGLRLSIRAARTSLGTSTSIPTMSAGTATTVATGSPFVQFQNNRANRAKRQVCLHSSEVQPVHCGAIIVGPGNSQPDSGLPCADRIKPLNLGRSPRIYGRSQSKIFGI